MNEMVVHTQEARPASAFVEANLPTPRRDQARSTIAGRRPDDFVFEPKDSTFYINQTLTLASKPIQRAFEVTFQRCQLALFETEYIAPIIARDDDGVRTINAALDKKFKAFETFMEGERNRINKLLQDNAKPLDRGEFTKPLEYTVPVYTPRTRRYLEMLQLADDMITTYARAWLEGFMDEINAKRMVFGIRVRTVNLAKEIWELHTRSFIALRKARQQKDEERQRLMAAREAARALRAAKRLEQGEPAPENTDAHDDQLAVLEAQVARADSIIEGVEARGGMEESAPDFGRSDLAAEDPHQLAQAEADAARRTSRRRPAAADVGPSAEPATVDA